MSRDRFSPYWPRKNTNYKKSPCARQRNSGHEAQRRGAEAESKLCRAIEMCMRSTDKPAWLISFLKTEKNSKEDSEAIDFIIFTGTREINIQVKSSEAGANRFRNKRKDFVGTILVIKLHYTYNKIIALFIEEMELFLKKIGG